MNSRYIKIQFQNAIGEAKTTITSLDPKEIGCVYLDGKGVALRKLERLERKGVIRHLGSVKGAWPRLVDK